MAGLRAFGEIRVPYKGIYEGIYRVSITAEGVMKGLGFSV